MDVAELKRTAGGPKKRTSIDVVEDEYVAPVSKVMGMCVVCVRRSNGVDRWFVL